MACGLMYLRVVALLAIFNRGLMAAVWIPLAWIGLLTIGAAYLWTRVPEPGKRSADVNGWKNPLELMTALFFALVFVAILIATQLVVKYLGVNGIYYLAAIAGSMDVDPFVLSLSDHSGVSVDKAAVAVLIAVSGNNLLKAGYALIIGEKKMGRQTALGLLAVILLTLASIWFLLAI